MTGSILNIILITFSFALLTFALVYIIASAVMADKIAAENRLQELNRKEGEDTNISLVKHKSKSDRKNKNKNNFFEKFGTSIYKELQSADIKMRPEEFITIWVVIIFVPACLVALFLGNAVVSIVLVVAGLLLPIVYIKAKQKSRVKKFDEQLSDALMICCSCLRSGLSFLQAMETIAKDMDDPISSEFDLVLREINMGYSMDEALDNLGKRIKSKHLALMISAVLVQRQTGGNLSQILENISKTIKDRMKLKKELKSSTASGKMSGMIVGAMPVILLLLFSLVSYDYVEVLYAEPRGNILLAVAAGLELLAFVAIKKITSVKM
ncbi:MAG: type II secretion system F family protein [Eubacterium sp.]